MKVRENGEGEMYRLEIHFIYHIDFANNIVWRHSGSGACNGMEWGIGK
jgi:hypothetical protein